LATVPAVDLLASLPRPTFTVEELTDPSRQRCSRYEEDEAVSRLWDTPEFSARSEADDILREMSDADPAALADSLECNIGSYDPELAMGVVGELHRCAAAGVRFWSLPYSQGAEPKDDCAQKPMPAWFSQTDERNDVTADDIPW